VAVKRGEMPDRSEKRTVVGTIGSMKMYNRKVKKKIKRIALYHAKLLIRVGRDSTSRKD